MDGALIIDKPAGWTSHDVVARVRKLTGQRRAGHTGTLDPFATGVLVILLGRATRLAQFLSGAEKEYEAVIRFGYATDSGDVTGARIDDDHAAAMNRTRELQPEEIDAALDTLRGEIEQIPPMYSAKKIGGQKLYELARRGDSVARQPVRINVREFVRLSDLSRNDDGADLHVRVVCSAGTYIRTLAEDLGSRLGVGAHLAELRRTRAGEFRIEAASTLEDLSENKLISPDIALAHLPFIDLSDADKLAAVHGKDLIVAVQPNWMEKQPVRMRAAGELIAVGVYDQAMGRLHPEVVIGGI